MANDFDKKGRYTGRVVRKWDSIRRKAMSDSQRPKGLTGRALEQAVMGIALADPSLVKFQQAGV